MHKLRIGLAALTLLGCSVHAHADLPSYTGDLLMNWAEWKYPNLFPLHVPTQPIMGLQVRAYPGAKYLGTGNGRAYFYDAQNPAAGIVDLGPMQAYVPQVQADGFPTLAQRNAAATQAATAHSDCVAVAPFYWEIGDANGAQASGRVGDAYSANSLMSIASASKWIYGSYVAQKRGGHLVDEDLNYLTFRSGYVSFRNCSASDTVHSCATSRANDWQTPAAVGKFFYGGGHMQQHADRLMGLGTASDVGLGGEIRNTLGLNATAFQFFYSQPQLAGGVATSAGVYAQFLRGILNGDLFMRAMLGSDAVCTNPTTCANALSTPWPTSESPGYSIGHWVEDNIASDGSFSSPGAFGFYPWIDANKQWYGVVARESIAHLENGSEDERPGVQSAFCGRRIRYAWMTGYAP